MVVQITDTLRNIIKEERKKRKYRGSILSEHIGKSPSYISLIEKGSIKTIDVSVLYKLFEKLIDLPKEKLNDYLTEIVGQENIIRTEEDNKKEEWEVNMEWQFRMFPISLEMIEFINIKLEELNKKPTDLLEKINSNDTLDKETLDRLDKKENSVFVRFDDDGTRETSIKFKLPMDFIDKILSNETKSLNRITLEAIFFNIFLLEGKNPYDAMLLTDEKIHEFKIYTKRKRANLIKNLVIGDKHSKRETIENIVGKERFECSILSNKIFNRLNALADIDPLYGIEVFTAFKTNLETDNKLIFAILNLQFNKLANLDTDKKKDFVEDINSLIKKYSSEMLKEEGIRL